MKPGVKGLMTLSTACLVNSSTVQIRTCCRGQRSHAAVVVPTLSQSGADAVFSPLQTFAIKHLRTHLNIFSFSTTLIHILPLNQQVS